MKINVCHSNERRIYQERHDKTHTSIVFEHIQELIKDEKVEIKYVQFSNNVADLFTKTLPTTIFRKHLPGIGMRCLHNT